MHYLYQDGKAVFKACVKGMASISYEIMEYHNLKGKMLLILSLISQPKELLRYCPRMGVTKDKVMINIDNTAIPQPLRCLYA